MPTTFDEKTDVASRADSDVLATSRQSIDATQPLKAVAARLAVPAFCALLLVPSMSHIVSDTGIWSWDQSFYGSMSINAWLNLITEPQSFWNLSKISDKYAPGIALVGQFFVPIGIALKSIDHALMLSIVLEMIVCLILIVETGKSLKPKHAVVPFIGALLVASAPMFVMLSQQYLVEPLQLVSVAYFFWILATFDKRRGDGNLAHLLFASTVCLCSKVSSPMYCLIPGVVILLRLLIWHNRELMPKSKTTAIAIASGLLALAMVAAWYLTNFATIRNFVGNVKVGADPSVYGTKHTLLDRVGRLFFGLLMSWASFYSILILPVVLAIPAVFWARQVLKTGISRMSSLHKKHCVVLAAALVQLAVVFVMLLMKGASDARYAIAMLPVIAVVVMTLCSAINSKKVLAVFTSLLVFQFCSAHMSAFILSTMTKNHYEPVHELRVSILQELCEIAADAESRGMSMILGVSLKWLNTNTLAYESAKSKCLGMPFGEIDGYTFLVPEKQVRRALKKKRKFVYVGMSPEFLDRDDDEASFANPWADSVLKWIRTVGHRLDRPSQLGVEAYEVSLKKVSVRNSKSHADKL